MEKANIKYKNEVILYFNQLALTLFYQDYFSYFESAVNYKDKIIDFIEHNIPTFPLKKTPIEIKHLGSNYIFYKSNQRTTWYIFFEQKDNNYIITNVLNNYSEEVKWL